MYRIVNRTRGTVLGLRVRAARNFLSRLAGLLGTRGLAGGDGLWIAPCRCVHTIGMRYPVDVAYLDGRGTVVGISGRLPPNRIGRFAPCAQSALELPAGTLTETGTAIGDLLAFEVPASLDTPGRQLVD